MICDTPAWNGVPENPERDGWHWVAPDDGSDMFPAWWQTAGECERGRWPTGWVVGEFDHDPAECKYIGPCLTPSEVAAREQAAAVAMRDAANQAIATLHEYEDSRALNAASDAVGSLPIETGALDAMLAQAREEGAKAEREACAEIADGYLVSVISALDPTTRMVRMRAEVAKAIRARGDA